MLFVEVYRLNHCSADLPLCKPSLSVLASFQLPAVLLQSFSPLHFESCRRSVVPPVSLLASPPVPCPVSVARWPLSSSAGLLGSSHVRLFSTAIMAAAAATASLALARCRAAREQEGSCPLSRERPALPSPHRGAPQHDTSEDQPAGQSSSSGQQPRMRSLHRNSRVARECCYWCSADLQRLASEGRWSDSGLPTDSSLLFVVETSQKESKPLHWSIVLAHSRSMLDYACRSSPPQCHPTLPLEAGLVHLPSSLAVSICARLPALPPLCPILRRRPVDRRFRTFASS